MGIRNTIASALRRIGRGATTGGPGPHCQSVDQLVATLKASVEGMGPGLSVQLTDAETRSHFHGWQYACATLLAEAVMQTPWHVQVRGADGWETDDEHPMARLLRRVNPVLTGEELWYYTMLDLLMVGKCWWYIPDNALAEPGEIYPLAGSIEPIRDPKTIIRGWKQRTYGGGRRVEQTYEAHEIVFLRFPKPGSVLGGVGPMQAAGAQIKLDVQITESQWAAMKQGIWPSALLQIPGRTPQERQQMLDEFNQRYAGARKTGRAIGVSDNVAVHWPQLAPRAMGFERGAERMRDMILAMYRVPRAILGLSDGLPRANVEGMHYVFARWSVKPKITLLETRTNQDLVHRRYGPNVRLKFDDPVPADREMALKTDEAELRNYAISINEYRARRGLDPVLWGDRPIAPTGVGPMPASPSEY